MRPVTTDAIMKLVVLKFLADALASSARIVWKKRVEAERDSSHVALLLVSASLVLLSFEAIYRIMAVAVTISRNLLSTSSLMSRNPSLHQ